MHVSMVDLLHIFLVSIVQDKKGDIFSGRVWPGATAFPDFLHPDGNKYWEKQVS